MNETGSIVFSLIVIAVAIRCAFATIVVSIAIATVSIPIEIAGAVLAVPILISIPISGHLWLLLSSKIVVREVSVAIASVVVAVVTIPVSHSVIVAIAVAIPVIVFITVSTIFIAVRFIRTNFLHANACDFLQILFTGPIFRSTSQRLSIFNEKMRKKIRQTNSMQLTSHD